MSTTTFNDALAWAAAAIAAKTAVMHFLQVRSRLMSGDFSTGRTTLWIEDTIIPAPIISLFKVLLVCAFDKQMSIDRLAGVAQNNSQNETYFLLLCGALSLAGKAPADGVALIKYYVYSRLVHNAAFLWGPIQFEGIGVIPVRALSYSVGVSLVLFLCKDVLVAGI